MGESKYWVGSSNPSQKDTEGHRSFLCTPPPESLLALGKLTPGVTRPVWINTHEGDGDSTNKGKGSKIALLPLASMERGKVS